jgi:multidrug efflux pump subunit AcrA (membrane-fusion protein)
MSRRTRFLSALGTLLAVAASGPALAHEGEIHAEDPLPRLAPIPGDALVAASDHHELIVRAGTLEPGEASTIRLLLSDWATNAPIAGARVEVGAAGGDTMWNARAEAPGVYAADVVFPAAGIVPLAIVVRRGDDLDLLTVDSLRVGPPPVTAAAPARGSGLPAWAFAAFGAFALLAIGALVAIGRRGGRGRGAARAAGLVAALSLAASLSGVVRAHEGELHGEETPAPSRGGPAPGSAPAGTRSMAKEAQFELGLLTAVARAESLAETHRAYGTVVIDPSASAEVLAPQSGKFLSRRTWRIGDRVGRGQALGSILVVDELPVRSPLAGTIAAISALPGQTVAAGQPIARVVNLARVRVEVALYGGALAAATRARTATVRVPALPGRSFAARVEGLAPAAGAGGPAVPLLLSVANAGDLLRPGMVVEADLELPAHGPAIVVPATAVLQTERGPAVFVKIGPEAFALRTVVPGPASGDRVTLARGVTAGERVVVAGAGPLLSTAEAPR